MRVGKGSGPKGIESAGRARQAGGGGEGFSLTVAAEPAAALAPMAELGLGAGPSLGQSLLAFDERQRALAQGRASLDCLDRLRMDILEGRISQETAARLAELLTKTDHFDIDAELRETVEEIGSKLRFEAARLTRGGRRGAGG